MVIVQTRSKRKPTGGRYTNTNPKRKAQIGREPALTKLGEKRRVKTLRTKGGGFKKKILETNKLNLYDPKTKTSKITGLIRVLENPANRHFVRRNIITKGTIVETEAGKAKVMNRPGQDGMINAVLIE